MPWISGVVDAESRTGHGFRVGSTAKGATEPVLPARYAMQLENKGQKPSATHLVHSCAGQAELLLLWCQWIYPKRLAILEGTIRTMDAVD